MGTARPASVAPVAPRGWILPAVALALATLTGLAALPARADRLDDALQITWEALWEQTGIPRPVARWDASLPVRWRLSGADAEAQRDIVQMATRDVGAAAGLALVEWNDEAASTPQIEIEIVPNTALSDTEPCVTRAQGKGGILHSARIQIRARSARRCTYHELMHAVGIPGHPSGRTVLSYFQRRRDELTDLDRLLLAAWYSSAMPRRATPLEAIVVLSEAVARRNETQLPEAEVRERVLAFRQRVLRELEALARGEGSAPAIVQRSGKANPARLTEAQRLAAAYLAMAYARGTITARDSQAAQAWLRRARELGPSASTPSTPEQPS